MGFQNAAFFSAQTELDEIRSVSCPTPWISA
jgi:hypothetical protein